MWTFIISEFGPWLLGAAGAVIAFVFAYIKGRGDGKKLERTKITEGQLKLKEKYDEIDRNPRDPDSAYERLLDRARKR